MEKWRGSSVKKIWHMGNSIWNMNSWNNLVGQVFLYSSVVILELEQFVLISWLAENDLVPAL